MGLPGAGAEIQVDRSVGQAHPLRKHTALPPTKNSHVEVALTQSRCSTEIAVPGPLVAPLFQEPCSLRPGA